MEIARIAPVTAEFVSRTKARSFARDNIADAANVYLRDKKAPRASAARPERERKRRRRFCKTVVIAGEKVEQWLSDAEGENYIGWKIARDNRPRLFYFISFFVNFNVTDRETRQISKQHRCTIPSNFYRSTSRFPKRPGRKCARARTRISAYDFRGDSSSGFLPPKRESRVLNGF